MKELSEQIEEIIENNLELDGYLIMGQSYAASEITALINDNYFPKEFVEWKDQNSRYCANGKSPHYKQYYVDCIGFCEYRYLWLSLDELFEYWKTNIKDK
jgi:hypothetical protein